MGLLREGTLQEGMKVEDTKMTASYGVRIPLVVSVVDNGDGTKLAWNKGNGTTVGVHREGDEGQTLYFSSSDGMLFPLDDLQPIK